MGRLGIYVYAIIFRLWAFKAHAQGMTFNPSAKIQIYNNSQTTALYRLPYICSYNAPKGHVVARLNHLLCFQLEVYYKQQPPSDFLDDLRKLVVTSRGGASTY